MRFSPLLLSNLIIYPLRYFFSHYAGPDLRYDSDENISKIEIGSVNDFHKIAVSVKPRILVSRGDYTVRGVGLTDNLAEGKSIGTLKGLSDNINQVFIEGAATILIEARQEGTIELVTDMVSHFIIWSAPHICETQGFKKFGLPVGVSTPTVAKEDTEKFQVSISVPYLMEEQWRIKSDALKLKNFFLELTKQS